MPMTDVTPPPPPQAPAAQTATPHTPAPAPAVVEVAPAPRRKGRFPGVASLILALLVVLGDIVIVIVAIASIASFASDFDLSTGMATFLAFSAFAIVAFWGGIVVAGLALLLGIISIISNRGRIAGVFGTIFSVLILLSHISIAFAIANAGDVADVIPTGLLPT
jgi:hypothetical protein